MRVSGLYRGRRREANIWLHAARRRFGPLCTYEIPQLFNATRLHYTAGVAYAGICSGAAGHCSVGLTLLYFVSQEANSLSISFFLSLFFSLLLHVHHKVLELANVCTKYWIAVCSGHRFFNEYGFNLCATETLIKKLHLHKPSNRL